MADAPISTTEANDFLQTQVSPEVLYAARNNLVFQPRIRSRIPTGKIKKFQVLQLPTIANFTARDKTEKTDIVKEQPATANVQVTINKHKYAAFLIEDFADIITEADLKTTYADGLGYALANAIDADIASLYSDFNSEEATGTSGEIIAADIIGARKRLNVDNAPASNRFAVVSAEGDADLLAIDNFVKVNEAGGDARALREGILGRAFGFEFAYSNNIQQANSPLEDMNMFFHQEAMGIIMANNIRTQTQYKLQSLGWLVVSDVVYGIKTLRTEWGEVVER